MLLPDIEITRLQDVIYYLNEQMHELILKIDKLKIENKEIREQYTTTMKKAHEVIQKQEEQINNRKDGK